MFESLLFAYFLGLLITGILLTFAWKEFPDEIDNLLETALDKLIFTAMLAIWPVVWVAAAVMLLKGKA